VSELSKGGSGCDETLDYWVSNAYLHPKPDPNAKPKPPKKHPREFIMADLPAQCVGVLKGK
jgi:penicillin-insensitive murein endopeptidase